MTPTETRRPGGFRVTVRVAPAVEGANHSSPVAAAMAHWQGASLLVEKREPPLHPTDGIEERGGRPSCGSAPVSWSGKVPTVRFRQYDPRALRRYSWGGPVVAKAGIPENHADVSSAANEIYAQAAGTCVMDVLAPGLSSVASEANVAFPSPFVLQVDNAAAQALACQRRY